MRVFTIEHPEIISLEDFYPTDNENIFIKDNGDTVVITGFDHCMVFRANN